MGFFFKKSFAKKIDFRGIRTHDHLMTASGAKFAKFIHTQSSKILKKVQTTKSISILRHSNFLPSLKYPH